jgi:hypothetical protein
MSDTNDIVNRLRMRPTIARANQFGDLETDRVATKLFADVYALMREAADEIGRLRVQALGTQRRIQDQDAIKAELWERIHAITAERDALAAELAALKAKPDPLAEMWAALAEYQPQADKDGHGESWRTMCEERTVNAALDASGFTRGWSANATMWVGLSLSYRGTNAEKSAQHAREAIDSIRRAKEAKP